MAYFTIGAYIFSDDFDRFYKLLVNRTPVIYTSARDKGTLKIGSVSNIGTQRFVLHRRFRDEKWLFIDPATQFNPETEDVEKKERRTNWGDPLIGDMDAFRRIRELMGGAFAWLSR